MSRNTPRKFQAVILIVVGGGIALGANALADSLAAVNVPAFVLSALHIGAALSVIPVLLGVYRLFTRDTPGRLP